MMSGFRQVLHELLTLSVFWLLVFRTSYHRSYYVFRRCALDTEEAIYPSRVLLH